MELSEELLEHAKANPTFDAVAQIKPEQPKLEIARLVVSMTGIPSPYVEDEEFRELIPQGKARIRSELPQDYDGLSGLFESPIVGTELRTDAERYKGLLEDLQSGTISAEDFMQQHPYESLNWASERMRLSGVSRQYGILELARLPEPTASVWRQVDGTHTVIMADPCVDGLYHLGATKPGEPLDGYDYQVATGKTIMHAGKHSEPVDPRPFVEAYDEIRKLGIFDVTQVPVMELVMGMDGVVQYLQYKKTGHIVNHQDEFEVKRPDSSEGFISHQVVGATSPEGREVDIAICPSPYDMKQDSSVYTDMLFDIMDDPIAAQVVWKKADIALVEQGLGFRDTHSSSTPMHGPNLTIATFGIPLENGDFGRWQSYFEELKYIPVNEPLTVKVVSNGRTASVIGNWPT